MVDAQDWILPLGLGFKVSSSATFLVDGTMVQELRGTVLEVRATVNIFSGRVVTSTTLATVAGAV